MTTLALVGGACAPTASQPSPPTPARPVDFDPWHTEAQGMLSDVLEALGTFDVFHAFRVTTADHSGLKMGAELVWDPPTSQEWDEATHVIRGLQGRARQLFTAVTSAHLDPRLWRDQRTLADATHDLLDLADTLVAYRDGVDRLAPGDAATALSLLDTSWAQWDAVAARWGNSRAELLGCAA